jgi:epoxyqueuosine reductase
VEGFDAATPYWLEEEAFAARFEKSPIVRAQRVGMARNVAVALGNWGSADAVAPLARLLADPSPVVRGHAAWGMGQILHLQRYSDREGIALRLADAVTVESDVWARDEMARALSGD